MIQNDIELEVTQKRIRQFEAQLEELQREEPDEENRRLSSSGFVAEVNRMRSEVLEYLKKTKNEANPG